MEAMYGAVARRCSAPVRLHSRRPRCRLLQRREPQTWKEMATMRTPLVPIPPPPTPSTAMVEFCPWQMMRCMRRSRSCRSSCSRSRQPTTRTHSRLPLRSWLQPVTSCNSNSSRLPRPQLLQQLRLVGLQEVHMTPQPPTLWTRSLWSPLLLLLPSQVCRNNSSSRCRCPLSSRCSRSRSSSSLLTCTRSLSLPRLQGP